MQVDEEPEMNFQIMKATKPMRNRARRGKDGEEE